jgi:hypothetical protein
MNWNILAHNLSILRNIFKSTLIRTHCRSWRVNTLKPSEIKNIIIQPFWSFCQYSFTCTPTCSLKQRIFAFYHWVKFTKQLRLDSSFGKLVLLAIWEESSAALFREILKGYHLMITEIASFSGIHRQNREQL